MLLQKEFYTRQDVVQVARDLIGKVLCSSIDGIYTSGMITESEAYAGICDKASHAWNGRRTTRTEIMFRIGGTAYVYLCYGIHSLFNVVTSVVDDPQAVLIRSIQPLEGKEGMAFRAGKNTIGIKEGSGPGYVSKLLGIHFSHSGLSITDVPADPIEPRIWIEDRKLKIDHKRLRTGPRVGVAYAGADAMLPYRFVLE